MTGTAFLISSHVWVFSVRDGSLLTCGIWRSFVVVLVLIVVVAPAAPADVFVAVVVAQINHVF